MEGPLSIDIMLFKTINTGCINPVFDVFMPVFTRLGDWGFLWIVSSVLYLTFGKFHIKKIGIWSFAAFLAAHILTNFMLKNIFARPRPFLIMESVRLLVPPPDSYSFPSGHAALGAAWAVVNHKFKGPFNYAFVAAAFLIGLSRIYVGVHFPFDVIAGWLTGYLCGVFVFRISKEYKSV